MRAKAAAWLRQKPNSANPLTASKSCPETSLDTWLRAHPCLNSRSKELISTRER